MLNNVRFCNISISLHRHLLFMLLVVLFIIGDLQCFRFAFLTQLLARFVESESVSLLSLVASSRFASKLHDAS